MRRPYSHGHFDPPVILWPETNSVSVLILNWSLAHHLSVLKHMETVSLGVGRASLPLGGILTAQVWSSSSIVL